MVIGWVSWNDDGLGSVDFFSRNGINVMSFNAMTSSEYRNLESVKTDFDNIGNIFEIRDKTDALYNQITGEVDDIRDDLSDILGAGESVTYCIIDGALDPDTATIWAYGDTNFLAGILNTIGMTNVFPAGGSSIGLDRVYEAIATQGIDIIIFITYDNVSLETSVQSWLDNPTLSSCDAIRNGDYFGTKLSVSYGSSPELLDYLEFIRDYVRGMGA